MYNICTQVNYVTGQRRNFHEQINNFINYINYFFKDRKLSAIDELNKLPNP